LSLTHTFYADDEETPLTLDSVTATLTDDTGVAIGDPVSATAGDDSSWQATFSAQPLGRYYVVWSGGDYVEFDAFEVVGGFLFTVPQVRASDTDLVDKDLFPADEIIRYREVVESEFEEMAGRSFTPRVRRVTFVSDGTGEFVSLTPDSQGIESVTVDGTPIDDISGWHVTRLGKIVAPDTVARGAEVVVTVRYGFTTPPAEVARVGMIRLRDLMVSESAGIPDRATTWQPEEGGTYRLATPGLSGFQTGIPEVDATVKRYRLDTVLAVFGADV